jgi:molecular chaperone DnaJ
MQSQVACDVCNGVGRRFFKDGKEIKNGGLEQQKETIDVKIPEGIRDGVFIKFSGKGNEGLG